MFDEKEREDHLSLDFHTGIAPDMQFRMKVNLIALLMFLQIAAYVGSSYINGKLESHLLVDYNLEGNGSSRTVLVAHNFLCVEVVNSLVLSGVTAKGETLAYCLKGFLEAFTEGA